jgi:hypothetical protein
MLGMGPAASRRKLGHLAVASVALLSMAACVDGNEEGDGTSGGEPSETAPTSSTSIPEALPQPENFSAALEARLANELGDAAVARAVVEGLEPEVLAEYEQAVPLAEVGMSEILDYSPEEVPSQDIDSVVVFAFGNRISEDGSVTGGPVNEELAGLVEQFVETHSVPVYAQWEVAEHLTSAGVADVQSIAPIVDVNGQEQYLSTAGVAEQVVASAAAERRDLGTVGVFCFADHAARCVETAQAAGMEAGAPEGVDLPGTHDPASGQPWTRDRVSYVTADLASRFAGA